MNSSICYLWSLPINLLSSKSVWFWHSLSFEQILQGGIRFLLSNSGNESSRKVPLSCMTILGLSAKNFLNFLDVGDFFPMSMAYCRALLDAQGCLLSLYFLCWAEAPRNWNLIISLSRLKFDKQFGLNNVVTQQHIAWWIKNLSSLGSNCLMGCYVTIRCGIESTVCDISLLWWILTFDPAGSIDTTDFWAAMQAGRAPFLSLTSAPYWCIFLGPQNFRGEVQLTSWFLHHSLCLVHCHKWRGVLGTWMSSQGQTLLRTAVTELKNDLGLSQEGIERKAKYLILHSMWGFKSHQDTAWIYATPKIGKEVPNKQNQTNPLSASLHFRKINLLQKFTESEETVTLWARHQS